MFVYQCCNAPRAKMQQLNTHVQHTTQSNDFQLSECTHAPRRPCLMNIVHHAINIANVINWKNFFTSIMPSAMQGSIWRIFAKQILFCFNQGRHYTVCSLAGLRRLDNNCDAETNICTLSQIFAHGVKYLQASSSATCIYKMFLRIYFSNRIQICIMSGN